MLIVRALEGVVFIRMQVCLQNNSVLNMIEVYSFSHIEAKLAWKLCSVKLSGA